jgi:MFS family permease
MVTSDRTKWFALALLCAVQFMVILDVSIVNVALPSIQADLGFSQEDLQWVLSAYALVFGGFLLLGGRLADILGRRSVFMTGLVIFTVGSLLCGLAWHDTSLIAARALQGLGAATVAPSALSILTTTFTEGRERNVALGVWGAVGGFGAAAGVLAGGILTDLLSWEWVFFVNIPVGVAALTLSPILLSESRDAHGQSHDVLGATLVTGGLVLLVLGITQGRQWEWLSAQTVGVFAASAVLLGAFAVWEQRQRDPLVPVSIFRLQTLTAANVVGFIMGTAMFSMFLMLSLYMQQVLELSALRTRGRLPRGRRHGRHLGECGGTRCEPDRRQAGADLRHGHAHARAPVLHPGLRRRFVLVRSLPRLPHPRRRAPVRLRADHDRSARGHEAARGGPGLRSDQHVAADRGRGGHRDPLDDRGLDDRGRGCKRDRGSSRTHGRLRQRVLGGRRDCIRRRPRLHLRRART